MLDENNGGSVDLLNAFSEQLGIGNLMDAYRQSRGSEQAKAARQAELERQYYAAAEKVKAYRERHVIAALEAIPDFEIPALLNEDIAWVYNERCRKEGIILPLNGHEWDQDEGELEKFRRSFPELCYQEVPRTASVLLPGLASLTS